MTVIDGVIPIACVPFLEDESPDLDALAAEADALVRRGVQGIGMGFGSELPRLSEAERGSVLRVLVDAVGGRVPVMASAGADSVAAATVRAESAATLGASWLMIVPPAQPAAGPEAIVDHLDAIASRVPLPIVVQDAPSSTGVQMPAAMLGWITHAVPSVVAVKVEDRPNAAKVAAVVREVRDGVTVLGGAGGMELYPELEAGAVGTMPGPAHTDVFLEIVRLHRSGDRTASRHLWEAYLPFLILLANNMDAFLFAQKSVLVTEGVLSSARLRRPGAPPDAALLAKIADVLADLAAKGVVRSTGSLDG